MYRGLITNIHRADSMFIQGCMFSPYDRLKRDNQRHITKLRNLGHVVLLTGQYDDDEEREDEQVEIVRMSFFNKRLFPGLNTQKLTHRCMNRIAEEVKASNKQVANK
jgi:hypothetical protein